MIRNILIGVLTSLSICFILIACKNTNENTINNALNLPLTDEQNQETFSTDTIVEKIYGSFKEGVVIIKVDNQYGLYDTINSEMLTPINYDNINSFANEGIIGFVKNKKYGFLNDTGEEIVSPTYDFVLEFDEGLAAVKLDDKWGYIDKTGKVVVPIIYEKIYSFKLSLAAVEKDGKWGYINKKGKYVIEPIFDKITMDFSEEIPVANVSVKNHHYFIDKNGKYLKDSNPYEKYEEN